MFKPYNVVHKGRILICTGTTSGTQELVQMFCYDCIWTDKFVCDIINGGNSSVSFGK
ncbi:MAG: hypothetical protein UD961_12075 [Bacteroidales bacterium]|nr:hypothetical protein [Bacteroidales bacterium]